MGRAWMTTLLTEREVGQAGPVALGTPELLLPFSFPLGHPLSPDTSGSSASQPRIT